MKAAVHPIMAYYCSDKNWALCVKSHAMILDGLDHTRVVMATFQNEELKDLKHVFSVVWEIHYFPVCASSQYKNKKSFVNLC